MTYYYELEQWGYEPNNRGEEHFFLDFMEKTDQLRVLNNYEGWADYILESYGPREIEQQFETIQRLLDALASRRADSYRRSQ